MSEQEIISRIQTCVREGSEIYKSDRLSVFSDLQFLWNVYRRTSLELNRSRQVESLLTAKLNDIRFSQPEFSLQRIEINETLDKCDLIWAGGINK